ncbi:exosome complex protein Rrp42 [archaeon]|jgi:exosome complex component RRP42|nr:exosome complex protein Rrp42 [archaeon]MBT6762132.1 exosome complex protein Rrp42 [archaeon]
MIVNTNAIPKLAAKGMRLDGREMLEFRGPIEIETGITDTAEGSSKVRIGDTVVIAGVKLSLEKPYPDTPDQGGIMINAELTPMSSSEYETGPPRMKAIEISRVLDRTIREAKAIDFKKLCVVKNELAWFVAIDIVSINDGGNLFDAASMAVLAALNNTTLRKYDPETKAVDYKSKTDEKLPLTKSPLAVTVYKVGGNFLVDPSSEEEHCYQARLTVGSDEKQVISALQKGGEQPITIDDVSKMVDIALEKAAMLRKAYDASK